MLHSMGAISARIITWQVVYRSYRRGCLPRRHSRRWMTCNRRNRSHKKVSMFRRTRSVETGRNAAAESLNRTRWDAMRLLPIMMIGGRRPSVTDPACVLARRDTSRRRPGVEERRCRVLVGTPPPPQGHRWELKPLIANLLSLDSGSQTAFCNRSS